MNKFTNGVSFKLGEEEEVKEGRRRERLARASREESIFNFQLDSQLNFFGRRGE